MVEGEKPRKSDKKNVNKPIKSNKLKLLLRSIPDIDGIYGMKTLKKKNKTLKNKDKKKDAT